MLLKKILVLEFRFLIQMARTKNMQGKKKTKKNEFSDLLTNYKQKSIISLFFFS